MVFVTGLRSANRNRKISSKLGSKVSTEMKLNLLKRESSVAQMLRFSSSIPKSVHK
jgi:hypothetical protein